ncbi:hypothetical protein NECAME_17403, partial [Necator americanus]
ISYLENEQCDVPCEHYNTLTGLPSLMTHSHVSTQFLFDGNRRTGACLQHEESSNHPAACNTLPRSTASSAPKQRKVAGARFITKK